MTDSLDKIRLKGSAKRYKRGPGPTGAARLVTRVHRLAIDASRVARTAPDPGFVARLSEQLTAFMADESRR